MESNKHHELVQLLYSYVTSIEGVEKRFVECDIFEVTGTVTRTIDGYIPDLFYEYEDITIIGEAKTTDDLDRAHSIAQYESYIRTLEKRIERGNNCCMVIATPWSESISALRILKRMLSKDSRVKIVTLNEVGVYKTYEKN